jgi:hypothetical protein
MTKTIKKINESPLGLESSVIYIRLTFWDDAHTYKEFDIVTRRSVLLKVAKTCKDSLLKDETFEQKIYEETINLAFRPKVKLDDFYTSVLKYICCRTNYRPTKHLKYVDKIVSHINIENDNESAVSLFAPPLSSRLLNDEQFKLVGKSKTSMALPSKLKFLNPSETEMLFGIQEIITNSPNKTSYNFSYGDLYDVMEDADADVNESEFASIDRLNDLLNTLVFYEFISIEFKQKDKDDIHYLRISLRDPEVYSEFFNQIGYSQSA